LRVSRSPGFRPGESRLAPIAAAECHRRSRMEPWRSKGDDPMVSVFSHRLSRAIAGPRAWRAALSFLRTNLCRSAAAFAAELGARCAINYLRSLDDDRLRDLGIKCEDVDHFVRVRRD
jgi:hypothetical protein